MSARKLGRLAGLVFVLAVVFGGAGAAWSAEHDAGGDAPKNKIVVEEHQDDVVRPLDVEWV